MKEISTTEAKAKLSQYLGKVEEGASIYITSHGRRVAELKPAAGNLGIRPPLRPVSDIRSLGGVGIGGTSAEMNLKADRLRR